MKVNVQKIYNRSRLIVLMTSFILCLSFTDYYPQRSAVVNNPFHNAFIFGLDGGITLAQTDYQKSKIGYTARGLGEYFFKTNSIHMFGLKLKFAYEQVAGEDDRGTIPSQDGPRDILPTFKTDIFSTGLGLTYSISIKDFFFPYISVGASYLWFYPKDDQNNPAPGDVANLYTKTTYTYDFEVGLKFLVSDKLSVNVSVNPHYVNTDYLDDVAAANEKDFYSSAMIGISYSPFFNSDPDKDGVKGSRDKCPNEPEDYDGFEDKDGCPDLDNDKDGIVDINDKCPNEAEDIDGFEDADGCPDLDNDGDGILDVNDKCPNEAEDIDGVEDEDGCPEIAGKSGLDGNIVLMCDDIFTENSEMIKIEGKEYLDDVITELQKFPNKKWRIEGHMDSNGNKRFLRTLSLERAKAVLEYLTYFGGLNREDFQVFGMGDNFPIDSNDTEEGRSKNRRIEIIAE